MKAITSLTKEQKIKYGFLLIAIVIMVIFIMQDVSSEVKNIETPQAESEKYNSKLEALEAQSKKNTQVTSLEHSFTVNSENQISEQEEEEKQNHQANKMTYDRKEVISDKKSEKERIHRVKSEDEIKINFDSDHTAFEETDKETLNKTGFFNGASKVKETQAKPAKNTDNMIYACIHENQQVTDGSRVKIRLTKQALIEDKTYPANTIIYGIASIKPNRMLISIAKINQQDIALEIFDAEDSNQGIYVLTPNLNEALKKELQQETLDDDDLRKIPFSKSLKNIFSKKIQQEKINLLNNYKLIIKPIQK